MDQDPYRVGRDQCTDLAGGRHLEWLVTDGCGGYAMTTVSQMLTRRYHGLLVAAVSPPVERYVLLAKLDVTASINGLTYDLATNDYAEAVHPHGYKLLESFTTVPVPTWMWRVGDCLIEQTLCMADGEATVFVRYRLIEGSEPVMLTVRPLCTSRHFHELARYQEIGPPNVVCDGSLLSLHWPGDRPTWHLSFNGDFRDRPDWYYDYSLVIERERGYDSSQDLFMPGPVTAMLVPGDGVGLVFAASVDKPSWEDHAPAFAAASEKGALPATEASTDDPLLRPLVRMADQFVVGRGADGRTVIAGYPWFGDWGRDTFISITGLCLVPGRFADARGIIEAFAEYEDQGLIPNRFPPRGAAPVYDTADAALWYVHAVDRYLAYTGDWDFVAERVFGVIAAILEAHEQGTRFGLGVCDDGLLAAGQEGLALTWMDARLSDRAVTPRIGKPVEINALWYNALRIGAELAERMNDIERGRRWERMAEEARAGFNARFWNDEAGCLYDVVDVEGRAGCDDAAIRPNQLLAVSLTHAILDESRRRAVVGVCEQMLWTPMGLRTLSPDDPHYRGRYGGDTAARDQAYHQGTVWPWLLGPFVTAYVRAFGASSRTKRKARAFLDGLWAHLGVAGLCGISEVADGDEPFAPGGCPWQAWSVAEPLRALCEDILGTHPRQPSRKAGARQPVPSNHQV